MWEETLLEKILKAGFGAIAFSAAVMLLSVAYKLVACPC